MGLSIEQKYNICLMAEKHPKWTQGELAQWAYQIYQLPSKPSQGTISRLLAKKTHFMNSKEHEKDSSRLRRPNNLLVHKILQEWVSQSIWNGIPVSVPVIQDTAQSVWHKIPSKHREGKGLFSHKWVANFVSRMNLSTYILDHGLPKPPKVWSFDERTVLKDFISSIKPSDLFTLDETFLAYNLPLDYAHYESNSTQKHLEVITVMLCANLDGTEKLDPMVIGRYNNYLCFKNRFSDENTIDNLAGPNQAINLGERIAKTFNISYRSNRKSWLTSTLFHDWLVSWDKRLVSDDRKIWILLDDSCSHRIVNLHLQNIHLIYTSSSSGFLPFNWGVLEEFKTRYRIQQYKALINLQKQFSDNSSELKFLSYTQSCLTIVNAFKFIKMSWDAISRELIQSNWKSSGIISSGMLETNDPKSTAFKRNSFLEVKLNDLCNIFRCNRAWDHSLLVNLNIEKKNKNFLSLEEIIQSSIVDQCEEEKETGTILSNDFSTLLDSVALPGKNRSSSEVHAGTCVLEDTTPIMHQPEKQSLPLSSKNQFDRNQLIPTVSQLIDSDKNISSGAMMENDIFSSDMLNDIFGTRFSMDDENDSNLTSIVYHNSKCDQTQTTDISSIVTDSSHPVPILGQQTNLPLVENKEFDHVDACSDLNNTLSSPKVRSHRRENIICLTTLQSNMELAKAIGTILRHSDVHELGLSQSSLNELRIGYSNCVQKVKRSKNFLQSLENTKSSQYLGKQTPSFYSITSESSTDPFEIGNTVLSTSLDIPESFEEDSQDM